jgi:hypothetical protein
VAAAAIVANPFAGQGFVEDLSSIVEASAAIGTELGKRCQEAVADTVDSYGKAGVVGVHGDKEHVHAALTSVFGNEFRTAIGGAEAWIASTKKMGGPGVTIDVPLAFKHEVWVRSHYDTISVTLHDAPLPDEMVIIAAVANRGRLAARVGGKSQRRGHGTARGMTLVAGSWDPRSPRVPAERPASRPNTEPEVRPEPPG